MTQPESSRAAPRVWCLLGRKAGDNTQVLALARRLGWSFEEKRISARLWELLPHLLFGPTLAGIDVRESSRLDAPWPDLVLTSGRRNEPVARWIQQQSTGRCRLVHIGRPWAALKRWDLIVTTPQYFLPSRANVLCNRLPLHDDEGLSPADFADWEARWAKLPRPWVALLIGGDSGSFVMTAEKGERLGRLASQLAAVSGGSLLVTDSARTPRVAGDACAAALEVPHVIHRRDSVAENPYRAFLALADAFVVTGESMSMLAETHSRGRPVLIFDPADPGPWWRYRHGWRWKPLSHRLAMTLGPRRMRRDVGRIQSALVNTGQACWLDERRAAAGVPPVVAESAGGLSARELDAAAAAVRELFSADGG